MNTNRQLYQTFLPTTITPNTMTVKYSKSNTTLNNPISICYDSLWHPNPKIQKDCSTEPSEGLVTFDISLNCLFTLEFLLKVLLAPDKPKFLSSIVSVFDMALRILRIFKISKISRGLRVLILTVKKSIPELVLLGFLLMNAEYRVNDTFPDIPQSFWWSIITLTAVGYGDMHPKGGAGYFVGSLTAISGCIVTGLAIPIVGNNFNTYYKYMKNQLMEDKYLKTLRKDMEATGGVTGTKSGLGVASDKGGLPLPGRKPRNINRRIIRGSKMTKNDNIKSNVINMMEIFTRSIKRLLPTRLINKNNCKQVGVPKTQTTDSMQLLTENQKIPNVFTCKTTITELNERRNSYKNQNNMSINHSMSCKKKLSSDKLDNEHRPSMIYPLATDQFLNSLLPSQLPLIPAPQIWVDGEELDDQLSAVSHATETNTNTLNASPRLCSSPATDSNEIIQNHSDHLHYIYSRMSIVSEEISPNSIHISSNIPCCTVLNVSD
ncbi:Potassium voltage-gated channel subfamily A member 6, partial [Schistosoma japonicum]